MRGATREWFYIAFWVSFRVRVAEQRAPYKRNRRLELKFIFITSVLENCVAVSSAVLVWLNRYQRRVRSGWLFDLKHFFVNTSIFSQIHHSFRNFPGFRIIWLSYWSLSIFCYLCAETCFQFNMVWLIRNVQTIDSEQSIHESIVQLLIRRRAITRALWKERFLLCDDHLTSQHLVWSIEQVYS